MGKVSDAIKKEVRRLQEHHEKGVGFDREADRFASMDNPIASRAMRFRAHEHWIRREMSRVHLKGMIRAADLAGMGVDYEDRKAAYVSSEVHDRLGFSFREIIHEEDERE